VAALAAVALLPAGAGCTGGTPQPAPSKSVGITSDSLKAADGGTLRVADSTFQITTPADTLVTKNRVKYTVVLENTSKIQAATGVSLMVRLLDASGRSVIESAIADGLPMTLHQVYPGQRFGAVDVWSSGNPELLGVTVIKMEVEIKPSKWVPPDQVFGPVTLSDVKAEPGAGGAATVSFVTDSSDPGLAVSPTVSIIYRDATGRLLGGDRIAHPDDIPQGRSTHHVSVQPPPNTDLSKT